MLRSQTGSMVGSLKASGLALLASSLIGFVCSGDDSPNASNGGGEGPRFSPQNVEVVVGDTIRWVAVSGDHTVTSGTGSAAPDAGDLFDQQLSPGESFSREFASAGVIPYFCRPHEADGMDGIITVSAAATKTVDVSASGITFTPANVEIQVGDAVRWTSTGSHTVTSGSASTEPNAGSLFDRSLSTGETFTRTFTSAGTYPYFCRPHESSGMKGTITVTERQSKTVEVEARI